MNDSIVLPSKSEKADVRLYQRHLLLCTGYERIVNVRIRDPIMSMSSNNKDKLMNELDRAIVRLSQEFSETPTLNVAVSSIPIFGPLIQIVMSNLEPVITRNRILELFTSLREEVLVIDQTKIDQTYFDTEEFYDIFRKIFEYTVKTRDRNKIRVESNDEKS